MPAWAANLIQADLIGTNLHGAPLCDADQTGADPSTAHLGGRDLRTGNLPRVKPSPTLESEGGPSAEHKNQQARQSLTTR